MGMCRTVQPTAAMILLFILFAVIQQATFAYPITASWFRDRFSQAEWNSTLDDYRQFGGDTIWLRGAPVIKRTKDDLARDPDFVWCGSEYSTTKVTGKRCWTEAEEELSSMGLNVTAFASYQYEEGFRSDIMLCPKYDRRIYSSRVYYRIVLPLESRSSLGRCDFPPGTEVVVLLTTFAGTDPHALLLESAAQRNLSVYFGLPSFPSSDPDLGGAYYEWVYRVVNEHKQRYSDGSLYNTLKGYYSTDEVCLAQVQPVSNHIVGLGSIYLTLYKNLGTIVHFVDKRFVLSPYIDLNRAELNATIDDHVQGFKSIANLKTVDVIAIQEGRGVGKGCYYWGPQVDRPVEQIDPMLYRILQYRQPGVKANATFRDLYTASNQQLFRAFEDTHDALIKQGVAFEYWLNVEAFEYLRDDPCLPVDISASGMGELLDRTSKSRVDYALTVAGARVQKAISFAWDSDYTCVSQEYSKSLASEIIQDSGRPIVSNCSFHSPQNLSVVVLGYNLDGETQAFTMNWTDTRGKHRSDVLHGYYFELDYGLKHNRISSLIYVMLYDLYDWQDLQHKGHVTVLAHGAYHACTFTYEISI